MDLAPPTAVLQTWPLSAGPWRTSTGTVVSFLLASRRTMRSRNRLLPKLHRSNCGRARARRAIPRASSRSSWRLPRPS